MKKNIAIILTLSLICLTLSGCGNDMEANSISNENIEIPKAVDESNSTDVADAKIDTDVDKSETAASDADMDKSETAASDADMDKSETAASDADVDKSETVPSDSKSSGMPEPDGTVPFGDSVSLEGYTLMDGREMPVRVSMTVNSVVRGSMAYEMMKDYDPDTAKPQEGMEYVVIGILITYEEGEPVLNLEESHASLDSAKLFFALTDNGGNAEQFTDLLNNSFYDISLEAGNSASTAVAFLISEDNSGPLIFTGWGQTASFGIKQACF